MAIQFVVEDGTSKTDATSYATVAEFRQYWTDRGSNLSAISDTTIQAYLNIATEYLDVSYKFLGVPSDVDQALEWPRYISEQTGLQRAVIESDEIPEEIKNAVCFIAYEARNGSLYPINNGLSSESWGGISKTYRSNRKQYPYLDKILKGYLIISGTPLQRVN